MHKQFYILLVLVTLFLGACSRSNTGNLGTSGLGSNDSSNTTTLPNLPVTDTPESQSPTNPADQIATPPPASPTNDYSKFESLLWEARKTANKSWSHFVFSKLEEFALQDLEKAQDVEKFCSNYLQLNRSEKINFWGQLIAAITKYESDFNPLDRYQETSMGKDPITGQSVFSEGLMQLSYQDITAMPTCEFDWNKDKSLEPKDPNKTILNPYKNLDCGIKILAEQVRRKGTIILSNSAYWAVLKTTYSKNKITEISELTNKLSFCSDK